MAFSFPASAVQGSTLAAGINTVWKFISTTYNDYMMVFFIYLSYWHNFFTYIFIIEKLENTDKWKKNKNYSEH